MKVLVSVCSRHLISKVVDACRAVNLLLPATAVSSIRSVQCCDAAITVLSSAANDSNTTTTLCVLDRRSLEPLTADKQQQQTQHSLLSSSASCVLLEQSIDSKWPYFLTEEGVRVLLVGYNLQDLLHNMILFER